MYDKIIVYKRSVLDEHIQQLNKYKEDKIKSETKVKKAYEELDNIKYTDKSVTFLEVQGEILFVREYIATLHKDIAFYETYIKYESNTVTALYIELEKFITLQKELNEKKKMEEQEREESELLELLNLTRKKQK